MRSEMRSLPTIILAFLVASCGSGNPGDGRESGTDKHEWSILQELEYKNREVTELKFSLIERSEYAIAQVPNNSGIGAFYILLNPKAPPFYKQFPIKQYNLN
jgi:hypothetical protein